jgi:anaerobic magnesium-protoporphyrin IX monomethyl ester cyclase
LLNAYFSGKDLVDIKGISYMVDQKIVHNQDREYIKDIDVLPYPDKELFDPRWYHRDGIPINEAFGTILTSRGCPGRCTFCSRAVYQNRVRYNSAEYVIFQMQELTERYGVNFLDITWAITSRVDSVDSESLEWMKDAGCTTITYGLESGSDNTLKRINKRLTADKIRSTVKMSYDLGFDVCANWMLGYPFESIEDVEATKRLVLELDQYIAMHNAGFLIPFPGTELYEKYKYLDSVKEYWLK